MSDTKPAEVILLAEKIGLPANASAEAITARVYEMQEKIERAEKLQAAAESLLQRAEAGEKAAAELKKVEARLFIERAISNQWIDKKDEAFYVEMFSEHPDRVRKHIEDQKYRSLLSRMESLPANDASSTASAFDQIEAMAKALMANEKGLSKSDAHARVMAENPEVAEAYRLQVVAGAKGGSR